MLTSLRKKIRPDNLKSDVRAGGRGLARRLYLASVVILLSFVIYYTVGGLFFLEAQGLVLSDRTVVASLYNARVVTVPVRPGERVEKGTLLLTMQSPDLLVELGRHYTHRGDIIRRDSEINSRLAAISTLKPQAATRQAKAAAYESAASKLETQGFASTAHLAGTARDSYEAARDLALLETEEQSLKHETTVQSKLRAESDTLIQQLEDIYDNGDVHSPVAGKVGPRVPYPGQVVRTGEPLLEILEGSPYVIAYLPTARVYSLKIGDQVIVTDGANRVLGRVQRKGNIADAIPSEFQSQFGSVDRREAFRVELDGPSPFPLLAKVRVVNAASPSNVTALLLEGVKRVLESVGLRNAGPSAAPADLS
ncbi:MAG TPA: HlyD family efflux transporter periplasmic adaptor subunit [Hyphomicrobium sp.]|nr:HlyD family efflux transporter periplasmic adaptor subunit [Hyphomicrobium sp.]